MTPEIDFHLLLPELVLVGAIAMVVLTDLFLPEDHKRVLTVLSALGAFLALVCVVLLAIDQQHGEVMADVYVVDEFSQLGKGLLLVSTVMVFAFGAPSRWKGEYLVMVLSSLLGAMAVASSRDLIIFVVAFELLAVPGYMLVAWNKRSTAGEGALKYYLLGAIATAVMLYGISFLYGLANSTAFSEISRALDDGAQDTALARLAMFFVVVGMAFKVSAVPFHFWAPDAYQAAPISVATFLSVISKAGGLLGLATLALVAFPAGRDVWAPALWALSALTMTVGNLAALRQTDLVRLLAYSSIAQAGYFLVPLALIERFGGDVQANLEAMFVYVIIYLVMNIGAFAIATVAARQTGSTEIAALSGMMRRAPGLSGALVIFMLSLAGVPPFGGWFAKLVIFQSGIEAETSWATVLVLVAAVNSVIGLVYYAGVLRVLWTDDAAASVRRSRPADVEQTDGTPLVQTVSSGSERPAQLTASEERIPVSLGALVCVSAACVIVMGVAPGLVAQLAQFSSLAR